MCEQLILYARMILRWLILGLSQEPILSLHPENQILFFDCIYLASCSIPICSFLFQSLSRQLEYKIKNTICAPSPSVACPGHLGTQEMISQFLLAQLSLLADGVGAHRKMGGLPAMVCGWLWFVPQAFTEGSLASV